MSNRAWDTRLALWMMRPFADSALRPNHVTTASLAAGLASAWLYATGTPRAANLGALLYCLSLLLDHADGELARLSGKTSHLGHVYDRLSDLIVKVSVFAGMGLGLRGGPLGWWTALFGVVAGVSFVAIFALRSELGRQSGPEALRQPSAAGFEIEDILYAVGPITWLGWLLPFVVAAALGAPLFAAWTALQLRLARRRVAAEPAGAVE